MYDLLRSYQMSGIKTNKPKHPGGRPTDYRSEYCRQLEDHMTRGLSFASFGGVVGVAESTLHLWKQEHLEFSESERKGRTKSMLFWEEMGVVGTTSGNHFNAMSWKFNMQNRFGWKDRQDVTTNDQTLTVKVEDYGVKSNSSTETEDSSH